MRALRGKGGKRLKEPERGEGGKGKPRGKIMQYEIEETSLKKETDDAVLIGAIENAGYEVV